MSRKAVEEAWLSIAKQVTGSQTSSDIWKEKFKGMNDKEFDRWINDIHDGKEHLAVWVPNGGDHLIDNKKNIKLAEKLGTSLFQIMDMPLVKGIRGKTKVKVMVLDVMVKRLAQLLDVGIYVPTNDTPLDSITGQPTKKASGDRMTAPEVKLLAGSGLVETGKEFMKDRGGDVGMYNASVASIANKGTYSQQESLQHSTGVRSSKVLRSYLTGIHLTTTKT